MTSNPTGETLILAPEPKRMTRQGGAFDPTDAPYIRLDAPRPPDLIAAAKQTGLDWEITASPAVPKDETGLVIRLNEAMDVPAEGYKLAIRQTGMEITASTPAGAFYGACTLKQIARRVDGPLPCVSITDWPDLANRGIMLDISRDKVPTMQTLYRLVDLMADWKLNQLQLYTEHTFAYLAHPIVWQDASPMTGEQVMDLDAYCASKFIELVPNQNSFGHMERWLKHDKYRPMAEQPDGGETAWGHRSQPSGLCPVDKRGIPFLAGLYDELLPHFTSPRFNVGLDETVDLGYGRSKSICEKLGAGRVYLDFLRKIHDLVSERGRRMQFWGDIIIHYPELIAELPSDITALEWGYEFDHPFAEHCARFAESGVGFYVCPGASNWNSISGRTDNAIGNITSAARNGLANGAMGMLNTSWGDFGHWDPLPVAYTGFLAGAMAAWNSKTNLSKTLADALSLHAFDDPSGKIGRAFYDLGNVYQCFAKRTWNGTVQWQMLFAKTDNASIIDGLTVAEFDELDKKIDEIELAMKSDAMAAPDADIVRQELAFVIKMPRLASAAGRLRLGASKPRDFGERISAIKDEHRHVWLLRNRPGGLEDSVGMMAVR